MKKIKLVSSDLNGTLVHQHTMGDMIKIYRDAKSFQKAESVFAKQSAGKATMNEAFRVAGPLTKGITLRQAIEYTKKHMKYVSGFKDFLNFLYKSKIKLVINSTGYSVTYYSILEQTGRRKVHGFIGNFLQFGANRDYKKPISERELREKIREYFSNNKIKNDKAYDILQATEKVILGINDEKEKFSLIRRYIKNHFSNIKINEVAHIGDTMGDSEGIWLTAKAGGTGIAFNYNKELEAYLRAKLKKESIEGEIIFIDKKSSSSDLTHIIPFIE